MKPTIYLAGSIRDGHPEEIAWREEAINRLYGLATIINPLAGKTFDDATGKWHLHGEVPDSRYIVAADFWSVDRSDIILFDFRALSQGYPNIGTLLEFGRSTARPVLRLTTVEDGYVGHESKRHFTQLHPFLLENSAKVFNNVGRMIEFARRYVKATTLDPRYGSRD